MSVLIHNYRRYAAMTTLRYNPTMNIFTKIRRAVFGESIEEYWERRNRENINREREEWRAEQRQKIVALWLDGGADLDHALAMADYLLGNTEVMPTMTTPATIQLSTAVAGAL